MPDARRGSADRRSAKSGQNSSSRSVSAKATARQRIAADRAARKRAELRRRLLLSGTAVVATLAFVGALVGVKLSTAHPAASETRAAAAVVRQATAIPLSIIARTSPGQAATPLQRVVPAGPPLTIDRKLAIVFVSEESCPFCAAERWPLVVALSHFGIWTDLGATRSSATDVYPNTATFSFRAAHYSSDEIALRTTELADTLGKPLQPATPLDAKLINTYDVPPFVNSADQSGAVPFLDIGNRYVLAGAQYNPQVLAGLSAAQIASQLRNPSSPVARAIDGSAKVIVTAIEQVLRDTSPAAAGSAG